MKRLIPLLVMFASSAAYSANSIETIKAYEGSWHSETEHFKTPYSKPGKETSSLTNKCWSSSGYFACNQIVDGKSVALIVFTYNEKDDSFNNYAIPADGGEAHTGKLLIKGNVWTFPWRDKEDGKVIYFHVVNVFTSPDAIEYRQEFSTDEEHWTVMAKGTEKKEH